MIRYFDLKENVINDSRFLKLQTIVAEECREIVKNVVGVTDVLKRIKINDDEYQDIMVSLHDLKQEEKENDIKVLNFLTVLSRIIKIVRNELDGYYEMCEGKPLSNEMFEKDEKLKDKFIHEFISQLAYMPADRTNYEAYIEEGVRYLSQKNFGVNDPYDTFKMAVIMDAYNYNRIYFRTHGKCMKKSKQKFEEICCECTGDYAELFEGRGNNNRKYEVTFKHEVNNTMQLKILFDSKIRYFFNGDADQGKIFTSAKEIFEKLCCSSQFKKERSLLTQEKEKIADATLVERLTGFNLATILYENISFLVKKTNWEDQKDNIDKIITSILKIRSPMIRIALTECICKTIRNAHLLEVMDRKSAMEKIVEQFEKNVPRINEFYELVYSLFVTEIKSYNEWDGNEKLMIKISDFPIYRDKERNKVLKAYERAHIEKLEGLNMLDEEIERLVKEYRYTSFLEIMKNKVEKSEILQDLIKSKKDNFERKLFAYIMKRIVNENLIYSDTEEDDEY